MTTEGKTKGQLLEEKLVWKPQNVWLVRDHSEIFALAERYKYFLSTAKTERECVSFAEKFAIANGFIEYEELVAKIAQGEIDQLKGQKVYAVNRRKNIVLAILGDDIREGLNIIVSHVDSPRLDLKAHPFYEDTCLALAETHYYGGIKKYQWVTIPLALHGKVVKQNGEEIDFVIGEAEDDPIFTITDLLPHLSHRTQDSKKMSEGISGEQLDLLVGSIPVQDEKVKEKVKLFLLQILHEKYGLIEEDFVSAEIEAVPAYQARDIGFDRGLIGGYGHDDRVCAYASLEAISEIENPARTAIAYLADKEEIGSDGNTGIKSSFLLDFVSDLIELYQPNVNDRILRKVMAKSQVLSADVNGAIDPSFKEVYETKNSCQVGYGLVLTKYTGARGKSGSNDANAEFVGKLRRLFNEAGIKWQTGELGKVDEGGGGTVAKYLAKYGAEVIDCGPAILCMHAPMEICSKADLYEMWAAFKVFYEKA